LKTKPYPIKTISTERYEFESKGARGVVAKAVEITPLNKKGFYNFGFGDIAPDGTINDTIETNNQDLITVLATVIRIMRDFINNHPKAKLFFTGSNEQRTTVYDYIVKRNYHALKPYFKITALVKRDNKVLQIDFDPESREEKLGFIIEKNNNFDYASS